MCHQLWDSLLFWCMLNCHYWKLSVQWRHCFVIWSWYVCGESLKDITTLDTSLVTHLSETPLITSLRVLAGSFIVWILVKISDGRRLHSLIVFGMDQDFNLSAFVCSLGKCWKQNACSWFSDENWRHRVCYSRSYYLFSIRRSLMMVVVAGLNKTAVILPRL